MELKSVLVVEDDESMLEFCATVLALEGYQVTAVTNSQQAVEQIDTATFDLVLTDHVKVGPEARSMTDLVKRHQPEAKVIVMSGMPSTQDAVTCYLSGASDYLVKPFTLDQFRTAVRRCLP